MKNRMIETSSLAGADVLLYFLRFSDVIVVDRDQTISHKPTAKTQDYRTARAWGSAANQAHG